MINAARRGDSVALERLLREAPALVHCKDLVRALAACDSLTDVFAVVLRPNKVSAHVVTARGSSGQTTCEGRIIQHKVSYKDRPLPCRSRGCAMCRLLLVGVTARYGSGRTGCERRLL